VTKEEDRCTSKWVRHPTVNIVASETASWEEFAILLFTRRIAWPAWYAISGLDLVLAMLHKDRAECARVACRSAESVIAKLMTSSFRIAHENA
jgi:hypothetical protein